MVRIKRRYIVLRGKNLKQTDILDKIRQQVEQVWGDFGIACLNRGFAIKRHLNCPETQENLAIVAVRRGVHPIVLSVAPLLNMDIVYLSGTIRKCLKVIQKSHLKNIRANIAKRKQ